MGGKPKLAAVVLLISTFVAGILAGCSPEPESQAPTPNKISQVEW